MKVDWHSIKLEGCPPEEGFYMITLEGAIEDLEEGPAPGERVTTMAHYYGKRAWGILEGIGRVIAWAERPEEYKGE